MEDWILKSEDSYRYQLLSRLKSDCDYYLNYGNRNPNTLWAEGEEEQIATMKVLWNSFPDEDKPEWLTWEEILEYEKKMCVLYLRELLLKKTEVGDLVMFHKDGWYVGCTIIDPEDLFIGSLSDSILKEKVKDYYYTTLDWTIKPVMIANI